MLQQWSFMRGETKVLLSANGLQNECNESPPPPRLWLVCLLLCATASGVRPLVQRTVPLVIAAALVLLGVTGCASDEVGGDAVPTSSSAVTVTTAMAAGTAVGTVDGDARVGVPGCAALTAEVIADAFPVPMQPAAEPQGQCDLVGGGWSLRISERYDMAPGTSVPEGGPIPGVSRPHSGEVTMNRGGRFGGRILVMVSDSEFLEVFIQNDTAGSDTYPNGPDPDPGIEPQYPPTEHAARVVLNALG